MARPKSVFCTISSNTADTTKAPAKDTSLGSAMKAGPISTVVRVYAVSMLRVSPWLARLMTPRCSA